MKLTNMKISMQIVPVILVVFLCFLSCNKDDDPIINVVTGDTLTDGRDGTVYNIVTIGTQTWMAKNLAYLTEDILNNGGWVYNFKGTGLDAAKATNNYKNQGVLYNWETAKDVCPSGWHIPSDTEWKSLIDQFGGEAVAGAHLKLTGISLWQSPNAGADNSSGFSAVPTGGYFISPKLFEGSPGWCHYWSSTSSSNGDVKLPSMAYDNTTVYFVTPKQNENAIAIRCIQD